MGFVLSFVSFVIGFGFGIGFVKLVGPRWTPGTHTFRCERLISFYRKNITGMETADPKAALRKSVRTSLRSLSSAAIAAASERACARAAALTAGAASVCCYLAMPRAECVTEPLLEHLFRHGKKVFVPRVEGNGRQDMRMLHVPDAKTLESFPRSKWGIPEPTSEQAEQMEDGLASAAIDLVVFAVAITVVAAVATFVTKCSR